MHAWRAAFDDAVGVEVTQGDIFGPDVLAQRPDALVSPANSFGYMDGGIDLVYVERFGWALEDRVRAAIREGWGGELPVGCALIVPTEATPLPWLICAPTMRVPMKVVDTVHAYLALRAALRAVEAHNTAHPEAPIRSILCPGLGTGVGQLPPQAAARQMRAAWDEHVEGYTEPKGGLAGVVRRHLFLERGITDF